MSRNNVAGIVPIMISIGLSLVLTLLPLPGWLAVVRPAFMPATVFFWVLAQPQRFGIFAAWFAGLLLDVCYSTPLGEHALAMALVAYISIKIRQTFASFPLLMQSIMLLPIMAAYEFVLFWIDGINGLSVDPLWRWLPVITTAIIWPLWRFFLERLTQTKVKV